MAIPAEFKEQITPNGEKNLFAFYKFFETFGEDALHKGVLEITRKNAQGLPITESVVTPPFQHPRSNKLLLVTENDLGVSMIVNINDILQLEYHTVKKSQA